MRLLARFAPSPHLACAVAIAFFVSTSFCDAQVNGRVSAGGIARYRSGDWGLVKGTYYNTSDNDETVTTIVTPNGESGAEYVRSLVVPAGSVRTSAWPVLLEEGNPEIFEFSLLTLHGEADSQRIVSVSGGDFTDSFISANPGRRNPTQPGYCGLISTRTESAKAIAAIDTMRERGRKAADQDAMLVLLSPTDLNGYAESLEPLDQLFISSPDLPNYPEACDAIRSWIQRGGRALLLLDQCGGPTAAAILGESLSLSIVDTTTPNEVPFKHDAAARNPRQGDRSHVRSFDEPVSVVRTVFESGFVHFSFRGWPALVETPLGLGTVFVTTVSPEVLLDDQSPDGLAQVSAPFIESMFKTPKAKPLLPAESLAAKSEQRIGYVIPGRGFAAIVLLLFTSLVGGIGLLAWKRQRPEFLLLGIPLISIVAAGPGIIKGNVSRSVAPPTIIESRLAVLGDGQASFAVDGVSTIYLPNVNETTVQMPDHTIVSPQAKLSASTRRRYVWTDSGDSIWTGFSQPAGATTYVEESNVDLPEPMMAQAAFQKDGVTVTLSNADTLEPTDAVLASLSPDRIALRPDGDGVFSAGPDDVLAPGEVSKETLLSETQIMHGDLLQSLLGDESRIERFPRLPSVLFWTNKLPPSVQLENLTTRSESNTLFTVPLRFEIPAAGEPITIPTTFLPYRAVEDIDKSFSAAFSNRISKWSPREPGGNTMLLFELPDVCRPFHFESAEMQLRLLAGSRTVTIKTGAREDLSEVETLDSPVGNFTIPISGELLNVGTDGGSVLIRLMVSDLKGASPDAAESIEQDDDWKIERVLMTVRGHRRSASTSREKTDANE